ncbi:hypothetical protein AB6A40_004084 [Gnathostoma spinigerum]|uniref:serine--tRNA ligase n=1 Tax=Gnathostoma spinigerum TaxID=75299 RepID=A0ABD6EBF9_9BILA
MYKTIAWRIRWLLDSPCARMVNHWAASRPELDFDYLLDERNIDRIRKNICNRKGVGDIDLVHKLWKKIQNALNERPSVKEYQALWDKFYDESSRIPNMSHNCAPVGDESKVETVRVFGGIKRESKHLVTAERIARSWRSVLYPRQACGSRSYAFLGPLAELEQALLSYVEEYLEKAGFHALIVPDIVPSSTTSACGLQQRSGQSIKYSILNQPGMDLSGTAEMGISDLIKNRLFKESDLPLRLTAKSRCYRPEVSKSAAEARLYRVHEFTKVEMYVLCKPEYSDQELENLVSIQCALFDSLGLHCRLLNMPTEELGASAARKFDIEAWMPGRQLFGEVSSASNCTDFQARRLGIMYESVNGEKKFAHTCNATAVATTRTLIAILETYQDDRRNLKCLPSVLKEKMSERRCAPLKLQPAPSLNVF